MAVKRIDFNIIDPEDLELQAFMRGKDSAAGQALKDAESHIGEVKFWIAKEKDFVTVIVQKL